MTYLTKDERRRTLLEATVEVVSKRGFAGVTTRNVAQELGAASGIVHHHFKTLTDLKCATLVHMAQEEYAWNETLFASKPAPQALLDLLDWSKTPDSIQSSRFWLSASDEATRSPEFAATYAQVTKEHHAQLSAVLETCARSAETEIKMGADLAAWKLLALSNNLSDLQLFGFDLLAGDQVTALLKAEIEATICVTI